MVGTWSYCRRMRDEIRDPWIFMLYNILSWLLFGSRSHEQKACGSSRVLGAAYCSGLFRMKMRESNPYFLLSFRHVTHDATCSK